MFLGDSTKLPALVPAGGTSEGFFDVGSCCYFILTRRFYISGLLSHWHFTLAFQAREGLHHLWALLWLFSVALLLPGFSVTFLPRALRFWARIFYLQAFFKVRFFPTFWHVLWLRCRNTPSRILLCACPHRFVLSGWCMASNYSYCSYKAIGLSKLSYWIYFARYMGGL